MQEPLPQPLLSQRCGELIDQINQAQAVIDALASLIGSCNDLHTVPPNGLAWLLDLIAQSMDVKDKDAA
jgi:hypothetical protein